MAKKKLSKMMKSTTVTKRKAAGTSPLVKASKSFKSNYRNIALITSGAYLVWRNRERLMDAVKSIPESDSVQGLISSVNRIFHQAEDQSSKLFGRA